ncbi:hypothetical protein BGZ49_009309 [Haplosporangium sp. Z 27]|nr:hypothetical protein BGZ49_009309 [Haplosporangium sp. Z 27]
MPINNNFNGPLETLPMSPCADGSFGFDAQFLDSSPLKLSESYSCDALDQDDTTEEHHTTTKDKTKEIDHETTAVELKEVHEEEHEEEEHEKIETVELHEEDHEQVDTAELHEEEMCEQAETNEFHETQEQDCDSTIEDVRDVLVHEHVHEHEHSEVDIHTIEAGHDMVEELTEKTNGMSVSCDDLAQESSTTAMPEITASGIPNRAVKSDMPTYAQTRCLSAASLELKKKQAAAQAAAAIKAVAVEIPETNSIANRIKMFGGACTTRTFVKKVGVRDIIQKYKTVEEQSQEQIAHVERGHNDSEPRGVCSAYSLSTASRPLRPAPRRKMSHELSENETRAVVGKFGGMARSNDDDHGVIQESVHSVKNAKSIFENLAR